MSGERHRGRTSDPPSDEIEVVFIGGTGRSGSTVIAHYLAERIGGVAIGETNHLYTRGVAGGQRCGCGMPFHECPFWTEVVERSALLERRSAAFRSFADEQWHRLKAIPRIVLHGRREATLQRAADAWGELFESIAATGERKVVVESSKEPAFWLFLRLVPRIRVHTLHVVRDSRAVAFSERRRVRKPEVTERSEYMGVAPYWKSALKWTVINSIYAMMSGRAHQSPFVTLRYEDFARSPDAQLDRVCRSLGLVEAPTNGRMGAALHHSVSGNPVRFDPERLGRITLDDEWRTKMPLGARAVLTALTVPLLARYGYLRRS